MDPKIILGRIIQRFIDQGYSQSKGYNRFEFVELNSNYIVVLRENGNRAKIYFKDLLIVIEAYQNQPEDFNLGPSKTRDYGITHINSPLWSLLHLLKKEDFN